MEKYRTIDELPQAVMLPTITEIVVPICEDRQDCNRLVGVRKINIKELCDLIITNVVETGEIEMSPTERGIKFFKL